MSFNITTGQYSVDTQGQPVVAGTRVSASAWNAESNDLASAINVLGNNVVNVKQFGALGDGSITGGAVVGTNDTAAINRAIAACGSDKTLFFPAGSYVITPAGLSIITCSVYGPQATALASTYVTDNAIFNLNYGETYPVTYGSGNTGIGAWKTFEFYQIIGSPDNVRRNQAIYCTLLEQSHIKVGNIRGCSKGVWLDGFTNHNHQGNNVIDIQIMYTCDVGLLMQSGDTGDNAGGLCENNRVYGEYWFGFSTAAISLAGGGTANRVDNRFEINSIAAGSYGGDTIVLGPTCRRNKFYIGSWDSGPSGIGRNIVAPVGSNGNIFQVPEFAPTNDQWAGDNLLLMTWDLTYGRSILYGTTAPTSGTYRQGDQMWYTTAASGTAPGCVCTISGTPGTWKNMANLA